MKIKFILAALAVYAFCACSQNDAESDIQSIAPSKEIGFCISDITRAEIRDNNDVQNDGFIFTMIQGGKEVYSNAVSEWNGTSFKSTPQLYWTTETSEENPSLFYAVSYPGIASAKNIINYADGKASIDVTLPTNVADQQDIVVATVKATSIPEDGIQIINFTHALTKVNYTLFVDNETQNSDFVWKVSSITMLSKNQGTYTFGAENPWTVTGEAVEMQYLNTDEIATVEPNATWKGMNNFMLIPQQDDLTIVVKWLVYKKIDGNLKQVSLSEASKNFTISTANWKPNASLRYANLRLPNVGENTTSNPDDDLDDNNIKMMGSGVDVTPWDEEIVN